MQRKKNELVQTTESPSTEDNGSKDNDDMEVEETSKEDSCEEMDTESSSNHVWCLWEKLLLLRCL